jgi:hypothetical protein
LAPCCGEVKLDAVVVGLKGFLSSMKKVVA